FLTLSYLQLKRGNDLRAGGLASFLFLTKPHFAPALVVLLALQRRWRALGGLLGGGAAALVLSLALMGPSGLWSYLQRVALATQVNAVGQPFLDHLSMVSWRGLLANLAPGLPSVAGLALTATLSVLTILVAVR